MRNRAISKILRQFQFHRAAFPEGIWPRLGFLSGVAGTIFGLVATAVTLDPHARQITATITVVCVLFLLLLMLVSNDSFQTPRAWSCIETTRGIRYRLNVDSVGKVFTDASMAQGYKPDSQGVSLAMSTDGTVLAILADHKLHLSIVDPRDGTIGHWKGPTLVPRWCHRVLAVSPKGDVDAWLALAEEGEHGRTFRISYSELEQLKNGKESDFKVGNGGQDTYAVFVGADLWLAEPTRIGNTSIKILKKIPFGEHGDTQWTADNWDGAEVIAVDGAQIDGHTYVALIVNGSPEGEKVNERQMVVLSESTDDIRQAHRVRLKSPATHVSVVRAPNGDYPGSLCVLYGEGLDIAPMLPFIAPDQQVWQLHIRIKNYIQKVTKRGERT